MCLKIYIRTRVYAFYSMDLLYLIEDVDKALINLIEKLAIKQIVDECYALDAIQYPINLSAASYWLTRFNNVITYTFLKNRPSWLLQKSISGYIISELEYNPSKFEDRWIERDLHLTFSQNRTSRYLSKPEMNHKNNERPCIRKTRYSVLGDPGGVFTRSKIEDYSDHKECRSQGLQSCFATGVR